MLTFSKILCVAHQADSRRVLSPSTNKSRSNFAVMGLTPLVCRTALVNRVTRGKAVIRAALTVQVNPVAPIHQTILRNPLIQTAQAAAGVDALTVRTHPACRVIPIAKPLQIIPLSRIATSGLMDPTHLDYPATRQMRFLKHKGALTDRIHLGQAEVLRAA